MHAALPRNRTPFTDAEVAEATGGRVVRDGRPTTGVAVDPAQVTPGALFVDLEGGAGVAAAVAAGAGSFVIPDTAPFPSVGGVVVAREPLDALMRLARAHRRRWGLAPHREGARWLVAVSGSWGRTQTARCLTALLTASAGASRVSTVAGAVDDALGIAGVLLGLHDGHRFAVVELGARTPGDLAHLVATVEPQAGVVTRAAPSALGTFDGSDPAELLYRLPDGAFAVVDGDDRHISRVLRNPRLGEVIACGAAEGLSYRQSLRVPLGPCHAHLQITRDLSTSRKLGARRETEFDVPLPGEPGCRAALLALAAAEHLLGRPFPPDRMAEALIGLGQPGPGQPGLLECGDHTLLLHDRDAHVPDALHAAFATAREIANLTERRFVAVVGEMEGLGPLSSAQHETLGGYLASLSPSAVVAIGGEASRIARRTVDAGIPSRFVPAGAPVLVSLLESVRPGDVVLMKGTEKLGFPLLAEELVALSVPR